MDFKTRTRYLKNMIVSDKRAIMFFLTIINLPVIGDIYDFFYFRFIVKKMESLPFQLTIEPNNICNLRCIMCPYKRMKRKKETMPMNLFKKAIDEAKELGVKDVHLTQYNEPFTDKQLFERIKYIREKGMTSSLYSNGTILDKKMREKILDNPPDLIRFSVDGITKKTFESIRVGANFEEVTSNIKKLVQERNERKQKLPVIETFFTVLDRNKKEAKRFLKEWQDKCDFAALYPADSRESKDFVGIDYKKLKPYPCFNVKEILILSNGDVDLCCVDIDGEVTLGNIKNQTLREIFESKKVQDVWKTQLNRTCKIPMCQNCSKFYIDSAFVWWFFESL